MSTGAISVQPSEDQPQPINTQNILNEGDNGDQLPTVATPDGNLGVVDNVELSDREAAAAAAEVSVMGQTSRVQRRDTTCDEAMIGATADGVGAFEMLDEIGELVKDRFLQFLME